MNFKLIMLIVIVAAALALIVPLFTDGANNLPTWLVAGPYRLVFFIIFAVIIFGAFLQHVR